MKNVEVIQKAIDYIEANLKEEISVFDVSKAVGYSLFHFIRLFESCTGHSPKDYLLRRRITEAVKEIQGTDKKLIDIAYDYQFGTPETLSRSFKRILGINPKEIRKQFQIPSQYFLTPINLESLYHTINVQKIDVEEVTLGEIKLAGLVNLIKEDKNIIQKMWINMSKEIGTIEDFNLPEKYIGYSFWSNNYDLDGFFYMTAIELESFKNIPVPLCTAVIPPSKYLKFLHKGPVYNISMTHKYIFQTFLPKKDYKLSLPFDFEIYDAKNKKLDDTENVTEILIPIE